MAARLTKGNDYSLVPSYLAYIAVSYTHLDVYKRQLLCLYSILAL